MCPFLKENQLVPPGPSQFVIKFVMVKTSLQMEEIEMV